MRTCVLGRQSFSATFLPSLSIFSMLLGNSAGPGSSTSELDGWALGELWHDFPHPASSAKDMCHQLSTKGRPGTHILALIRATFGSAPAKGSGTRPAPAPGPVPCAAEGSSAATEACRRATSLRDRRTGGAGGGGRHK